MVTVQPRRFRIYFLSVALLTASVLFSQSSMALYFVSCASCGCSDFVVEGDGLRCRTDNVFYSADLILHLIELGEMTIELDQNAIDEYQAQRRQQNLLHGNLATEGVRASERLEARYLTRQGSLGRTGVFFEHIVPYQGLAHLYTQVALQLNQEILNQEITPTQLMAQVAQLAMLTYLFIRGSNIVALGAEPDRAIRIWALFQYWLLRLAGEGDNKARMRRLWQIAVATISPLSEVGFGRAPEPVVVAPLSGYNWQEGMTAALVRLIRGLGCNRFGVYRLGETILMVYVSPNGGIYLMTPGNMIISVSPEIPLENVLQTFIPAPPIAPQSGVNQQAAEQGARIIEAPEYGSLTERDWQVS